MTAPDNPGRTEPDRPRAADPGEDQAPAAGADTQAGSPDTPDDLQDQSPPELPQQDAAGGEIPPGDAPAGSPQPDPRPPEVPPAGRRGNGSTNGSTPGVTSDVSSRPRAAAAAPEAGPATVSMQRGQPEQPDSANQPPSGPRPADPAYEHSPSSVPLSPAAPRYGRPVAQPFNTQSSRGTSPNFSQPTVRIGGRVQTEQAPPQQQSGARVRPTRIPRRASLQLRYLEPWSVLKVSLVLSVAGFLAWMVAVGVLYSILGGMGVWDQLNGTYSDLTSVSEPQASGDLISAGGVFGVAALVGLVNIVLITAMCTVGAFIYNASADLAGGIEVTLSERD